MYSVAPLIIVLTLLPDDPQVPPKQGATETKTRQSLAVMKDAASRYRFRSAQGEGPAVQADP